MREEKFSTKCWKVFYPIGIYLLMSQIVPIMIMLGWAVTAVTQMVVQGINLEHFDVVGYVWDFYDQNTMWILIVTNACILPILYIIYRNDCRQRVEEKLGLKAADIFWIAVATITISRVMNHIVALTPLPYYFTGYEGVSESIYNAGIVPELIATVIAAPFAEELLMRGILFKRIKSYTGNYKSAMILSALAFGIFHGNVVQGAYAFGVGLLFAYFMERYGNLWAPIIAHMVANAVSVLVTEVNWFNRIYEDTTLFLLTTAALAVIGINSLKKIERSKPQKPHELYEDSDKWMNNY